MKDRSATLRQEIDTYRRFLDEGVDPELERLLIERVAVAELELQIIEVTRPRTIH